MRFPGRSFWGGVVCGAALMVIVGATSSYLLRRAVFLEVELPPPPLPVPELANLDWKLYSLDGVEIPADSFRGRVVFLNFWATWCLPCLREMPRIQELYSALKDEVTFACVSDEPVEKLKEFVNKERYQVPVYSLRDSRPQGFETPGVPATFILDRNGKIVFRHAGPANWAHPKSTSFLRSLLDEDSDL